MSIISAEAVLQCKSCYWEAVSEVNFDRDKGTVYEDSPAVAKSIVHAEEFGVDHTNFEVRGETIELGTGRITLITGTIDNVRRYNLFSGTVWEK